MAKSQKELAFLRDLYIYDNWTNRFAELADQHLDLSESENLLYINAGTGGHPLAIGEKFGDKTDIFAYCENEDLLKIARDKGAAVSSPVDFSTIRFEDDAFDAVLGDATLVDSADIDDFIVNAIRVARTGGDVAVILPTAGSFGEIFSLLWETLYTEKLGENGAVVERIVGAIPTVPAIEAVAKREGLVNVQTKTSKEVFEYEDGAEFISSPLVAEFMLPVWLKSLDDEEKEQVSQKLALMINSEEGATPFSFTVNAVLLTGEKE